MPVEITTRPPLTERQAEVLGFVRAFRANYGYLPTYQDITDEFGMKSKNGALSHVKALRKKGYIMEPSPGSEARTIQPVGWTTGDLPTETTFVSAGVSIHPKAGQYGLLGLTPEQVCRALDALGIERP